MFCSRPLIPFLLTALLALPAAAKAPIPRVAGGYKGAIVTDAVTGNVLFEDHPDLVNPPASMVKLMTFAVLSDKLASGAITLATPITVTAAEARFAMKKDSTSVWLKEKEIFPVEELIYAMMVQSANDAALTLARAAAGSSDAFVELMNAKARELGMTHSTFHTPHGLTTAGSGSANSDLTTPRDYALLCRHLLLHTDVLKYSSVKERQFGAGQRTQPVAMRNHNHLLGKIAGVDGLKTGYTIPAGFCLATTVQRNNRRLIIVTLGGTDSKERDLRVAELIERGFAALPPGGPVFTSQAPVKPAPAPGAPDSPLTPVPMTSEMKKAATARAADDSAVIKFTVPGAKK